MKELSLFTGMGGGIYGSLILDWKTVAYVEKDKYCQRVIKQRIADGWFDKGNIYGDIGEFNKHDAYKYRGKIDVLTGGFPCQPFSVAGKRQGTSDERYLFDEIIKTIEIVRPRQLFFENVRGLLTDPAIVEIYESITGLGYDVKPALILGSDDCGNIHRRKRVWILANATKQFCDGTKSQSKKYQKQQKSKFGNDNCKNIFTYAKCGRRAQILCSQTEGRESAGCNNEAKACDTRSGLQPADSNSERNKGKWSQKIQRQYILQRRESIRSREDLLKRPDIPEPLLCRVDDELSDWKQRLKAVGNGQDPIVMATAYCLLDSQIE